VLRGARFYLVALPFAFVASTLLYSSPALLFYGLFWFGFLAALAVTLLFAAIPWQASGRLRSAWRSSLEQGLRAGTVLAYLALLTLVGALADVGGPVVTLALVPVSAALTFIAIIVLRQPTRLRALRRSLAVLPSAGIAALATIVMTGPAAPPEANAPDEPRDGSLLLMSGIDSASGSGAILEIDPHVIGFPCEQTFYFSYAGPGEGQPQGDAQCPITTGAAYEEEDTLRSRDELVPWFDAQLDGLPQPVTAAVHSQGVWIAWDAASRGQAPGLETLVLVGAFPENPVAFVASDDPAVQRSVGAAVLRVAERLPRPGGGTTVFRFDAPLTGEWLAHPDAVERTLAEPLPADITAVSIASLFDLPLMPDGHRIDGAEDACPVPVTHPNLPYAPELLDAVERAIDGRPQADCPFWRTTIGPLFRHHAVPPMAGN
jgi:hypothetical protein